MTNPQGTAGQAAQSSERSYASISEQFRGPRVIDLSNDGPDEPQRGGYDPGVPQFVLPLMIAGRLLTAHTADYDDPGAPVWIDPCQATEPGEGVTADLRCPGCVSRAHVGPYGADTLAVISHQRGCRWLAGTLRASGLAT